MPLAVCQRHGDELDRAALQFGLDYPGGFGPSQ